MGPPSNVLSFDETDTGNEGDVIVQNPSYDYVPPTHVSLYISNQGGYSPPYIYQILAEIYNSEDLPELHGPLNMNRESFIRNSK
jgi:translation initiation factor eIF-2B subunit beta